MRYKELEIWKRSYQVVLQVYSLLKTCRDHGLKDQISRSAVSVPSNIAEGSERGSYKDNIRFLYIAKGSCAELATQISLAVDLGYIPGKTHEGRLYIRAAVMLGISYQCFINLSF